MKPFELKADELLGWDQVGDADQAVLSRLLSKRGADETPTSPTMQDLGRLLSKRSVEI